MLIDIHITNSLLVPQPFLTLRPPKGAYLVYEVTEGRAEEDTRVKEEGFELRGGDGGGAWGGG